jgi:hypothetical protein
LSLLVDFLPASFLEAAIPKMIKTNNGSNNSTFLAFL